MGRQKSEAIIRHKKAMNGVRVEKLYESQSKIKGVEMKSFSHASRVFQEESKIRQHLRIELSFSFVLHSLYNVGATRDMRFKNNPKGTQNAANRQRGDGEHLILRESENSYRWNESENCNKIYRS